MQVEEVRFVQARRGWRGLTRSGLCNSKKRLVRADVDQVGWSVGRGSSEGLTRDGQGTGHVR